MALFLFTKAILSGEPIKVFNHGNMQRDFTYIDDIVEGVFRIMKKRPEPNSEWSGKTPDPGTSYAPYRIYNIGNNNPENLMRFIAVLEDALGAEAEKQMLDMQPGDVPSTYADIDDLYHAVGFRPQTTIEEGINRFVAWYKTYYDVT